MTADPTAREIRPKAYVALFYCIDAYRWRERYNAGLVVEETPYGFHHAEQFGFDVTFAQDAPRRFNGKVAAFITRVAGFDLLHAWTNRKRASAADVIWTMTEGEGFALAFLMALKIMPRKPIICNVVWLLNEWDTTLWYKERVYRFLTRYISILTVHTEFCLAVAKRAFPQLRSELMYFGVNSDVLVRQPPRTVLPGEPLNILAMGADKTRDWKTLFAAFGNDPRFKLTVVCWRLNDSDLAGYDNVVLFRIKNRADFLACFQDADLAVVPMTENIFSGITSALDAASAGVPVIASKTGGISTYFTDEEVYFVPVGDPAAMREIASSITSSERLATADRAHRRFLEYDYSSRRVARNYCDLSRGLLARGGGPGL